MRYVENVDNLEEMATAAGYTFKGAVFGSLLPGESSHIFTYTPAEGYDFWLILDPAMGDFTLTLIDPLGRVFTNERVGIVNPVLHTTFPTPEHVSSLLVSCTASQTHQHDSEDCCSSSGEFDRHTLLDHLPFFEPILPALSQSHDDMRAAPAIPANSTNMIVRSLGREGLAVSNPIYGEWQFFVTSNNTALSVFAVGIAERESQDDYIIILTAAELDAVRRNLSGSFRLRADIDLSGFANWQPINNFTGSFDGNGHTISGLRINRATTSSIGLFGSINNANIRNLTVELGGDIFGLSRVGVIAGSSTHRTNANGGSVLQNNTVIGNGFTVRATALLLTLTL